MAKRLLVLALVVAVLGFYLPSGVWAADKIKIGIIQYSDSAHYVENLKGIFAQLKKEGFNESNVSFDTRDTKASNDKVAEVVKEFKGQGLNLIIAIGTTPLIYAFKEIKDIPIVFSYVFDPIGAGAVKSWESSGNNTTGTSNWVDMATLVNTLRQTSPVKRLGVFYTATEKNTVIQLDEFKKIQEKMGFVVVEANISKTEEAGNIARSLVNQVDTMYITGGSLIAKCLKDILEVAIKAKIPTGAHLPERVKEGVLVAVSADSYKLGELTGKQVAQVLRGTKPSDIPIGSLKTYNIGVNLKTAEAMGLKLPVALLKAANQIIQE